MAIVKWRNRDLYDPWKDFRSLQDEINELFNMDRKRSLDNTGLFERSFSPAIDIVEKENEYAVSCELPGLEQKDIDISIASNVLTIKGAKKDEKEVKEGKYFRKESWSGSFHRTLPLPSVVDAEKITAQLKDGVLNMILPKKEEAKPRQISIAVK